MKRLAIASITGVISYNISEVPSFSTKDIKAILKLSNNGSAPLNEISIIQQYFSSEFQPPDADEIKMLLDGSEIELALEAISFEDNVFKIELKDLKDSSTGMFEPKSTIEFLYPIHAIKPVRESMFQSEVIYLANTYPLSTELEFRPEVPIITAVHVCRKFRVGKQILSIAELCQYKIILFLENIGEMRLKNLILVDKVPDNFEYGSYSIEPEITDDLGTDTLKWVINELEEGERLEISYEITGKGDYRPSEAQVARFGGV